MEIPGRGSCHGGFVMLLGRKRVLKYIVLIVFIFSLPVYSKDLPKLLILDITNKSHDPDFQYLENSIAPAIRDNLQKRYVFQELDKDTLNEVAEKNYQFREDFFTKSSALNLGLLTKQDVVIAGNFEVEKGKGDGPARISIMVRIFDINKRKMIDELIQSAPIDNKIFESIQEISQKVAERASAVLPNKEDWEKKSLGNKSPPRQFLINPRLSIGVGGIFFLGGLADRIIPTEPSVSLYFSGNLAIIHPNLVSSVELTYFSQSPDPAKNPELSGFTVNSTNILGLIYGGWQFNLLKKFSITPLAGGGILYQYTTFTGIASGNTTLFIPVASIGADFSYMIYPKVSLSLIIRSMLEIESSAATLVNFAHAGVTMYF